MKKVIEKHFEENVQIETKTSFTSEIQSFGLCKRIANPCTDKLDVYRESGGKLTLEKDRFYILATKVCAAVALRLGQPAVID